MQGRWGYRGLTDHRMEHIYSCTTAALWIHLWCSVHRHCNQCSNACVLIQSTQLCTMVITILLLTTPNAKHIYYGYS